MSETMTLEASARDRVGKGSSRALRRAGRVPVVVYGNREEPLSLCVDTNALRKQINSGHFLTSVVNLLVGGKNLSVLPREVQLHPVTDNPLHVDFLRIGAHTQVTVAVPVRFTDEDKAPGIKAGGILSWVRRDVELRCPADQIPEELVCSIAGLEVGDSIHISRFTLPEGIEPVITDRDFTVATIAAPTVVEETTEVEEEAEAEGGEDGDKE